MKKSYFATFTDDQLKGFTIRGLPNQVLVVSKCMELEEFEQQLLDNTIEYYEIHPLSDMSDWIVGRPYGMGQAYGLKTWILAELLEHRETLPRYYINTPNGKLVSEVGHTKKEFRRHIWLLYPDYETNKIHKLA